MGVLDKIKNALFEVEYVEVDEPPKKEKKVKNKDKSNDQPIAKKIVLPGKKNDKVERVVEEDNVTFDKYDKRIADELADEIIQNETLEKTDKFKIMDDNDFKVEEEYSSPEPVVNTYVEKAEGRRTKREDYYENTSRVEKVEVEEKVEQPVYTQKNPYENQYSHKENESKLYGVDNSYSVPVHEYGTYEKKEEKTYFKPSPIISPIYGILDKNYRKEDVVQKKEIRLTTNYTRSNVSVDDIRDKAYGEAKKEETKEVVEDTKFELEDDGEDDNLLVDLSDRAKPEVKELTMGDAMEYFQDLGLEYNVDYVDVSKQNSNKDKLEKTENADHPDKLFAKTMAKAKNDDKPVIHTHVSPEDENMVEEELDNISYEEPKLTSTVEVKDESKNKKIDNIEDDDNLFDLIDSMYQENE